VKLKKKWYNGLILISVGLLVCYSVYSAIEAYQGDTREVVNVNPGPFHPFWEPLTYHVLRVPSYLLGRLIVGVIISTVGSVILIYHVLSQERAQQSE
jgi:uncharacterized membrane protein